jgi:hypothetical protein
MSLILRQPRRRLGHRIIVVHQQDVGAVSVSLPRLFALRYRRVFGKNLEAGSHHRSREISNRLDGGELGRYSCLFWISRTVKYISCDNFLVVVRMHCDCIRHLLMRHICDVYLNW